MPVFDHSLTQEHLHVSHIPPRPRLRTPSSNRLSEAPNAPAEHGVWGGRDSAVALHRMVSPKDLSVVFQPIVDLGNGHLFAYEALVRCVVPELSSPPALFDHALTLGCVGRLGRMIREIAVPLCSNVALFVNVHPQELSESWLIRPDDPIYMHDHDVYLEITESMPFTHFELCMTVLREVRARGGVHLVVDDLGAGYSNLKRIADLEPRVVKLDRDLILGVERSRRQRQLVQSVVQLCDDLQATVMAEGIETRDEYVALRDTGVRYGQGYFFARPGYPLPKTRSLTPLAERSQRPSVPPA